MAIFLVGVNVAHARPKPAAPVPVCMPSNVDGGRVVVANSGPVVCWTTDAMAQQCIALSQTAAPKYAAAPRVKVAQAGARLREERGRLSACAGARCKPLGKKLRAAIKQAKAEGRTPVVKASPDLQVVIVGSAIFSIDKDEPLELEPPKEYEPGGGGLTGIALVGKLVIASWADCAGPCGKAVVVDASGANQGGWFPAGDGFVLDERRVVVVSGESEASITVIDVATAQQLGTLQLSESAGLSLVGGVIDPRTMVALWPDEDAWKVQWISVPAGKAPSLGVARTLPSCP